MSLIAKLALNRFVETLNYNFPSELTQYIFQYYLQCWLPLAKIGHCNQCICILIGNLLSVIVIGIQELKLVRTDVFILKYHYHTGIPFFLDTNGNCYRMYLPKIIIEQIDSVKNAIDIGVLNDEFVYLNQQNSIVGKIIDPDKILTANIKQLDIVKGSLVAATKDKQLYWIYSCFKPSKIKINGDCLAFYANSYSSCYIFITTDGLYGYGDNTYGQLGSGYGCTITGIIKICLTEEFEPIPQIISISYGENHTAILTTEGLFTAGLNSYNQLGHSGNSYKENKFKKVDLPNILAVGCGRNCTIVLTNKGLQIFGNSNMFS